MAIAEIREHLGFREGVVTKVAVSKRVGSAIEARQTEEERWIERTGCACCDDSIPSLGWRPFSSALSINRKRRSVTTLSCRIKLPQHCGRLPIDVGAVDSPIVQTRSKRTYHSMAIGSFVSCLAKILEREGSRHAHENNDQFECEFTGQRAVTRNMPTEPRSSIVHASNIPLARELPMAAFHSFLPSRLYAIVRSGPAIWGEE